MARSKQPVRRLTAAELGIAAPPPIAAAQHTPGPWKARDYRSDGKAGNAQAGSIWIDCDAWTKRGRPVAGTVAEVYARGTGSDDPAVQDANARLIALAPEMLAALRAAEEADDALHQDRGGDGYAKWQRLENKADELRRAVLAKMREPAHV